jgi:hypothetical protein
MRLAKKVTEGPIGVGTTFPAEMKSRSRVVPMTIQFTEYEPPRRIAERVQMKAMDVTGSHPNPSTVERGCDGCGTSSRTVPSGSWARSWR